VPGSLGEGTPVQASPDEDPVPRPGRVEGVLEVPVVAGNQDVVRPGRGDGEAEGRDGGQGEKGPPDGSSSRIRTTPWSGGGTSS
jgi:hypothetical protein